jgi:hypothetical protein
MWPGSGRDDGQLNIIPAKEDRTILLEQLKYYGSNVNVVELYNKFNSIHERLFSRPEFEGYEWKSKHFNQFDQEVRTNFLNALAELKYLGYVSSMQKSTFLFKKNIFSKPNYMKKDLQNTHPDVV